MYLLRAPLVQLDSGRSDAPRLRRVSNPDQHHPVIWEYATQSILGDIVADLVGPDGLFRTDMARMGLDLAIKASARRQLEAEITGGAPGMTAHLRAPLPDVAHPVLAQAVNDGAAGL